MIRINKHVNSIGRVLCFGHNCYKFGSCTCLNVGDMSYEVVQTDCKSFTRGSTPPYPLKGIGLMVEQPFYTRWVKRSNRLFLNYKT